MKQVAGEVQKVVAGIDVGKRQLDVSVAAGPVKRFVNTAALSAIRHNTELRRFYQGLRQRGKPGKVALTAVMRKLLLQLNAVAQRGTPWVEHYKAVA